MRHFLGNLRRVFLWETGKNTCILFCIYMEDKIIFEFYKTPNLKIVKLIFHYLPCTINAVHIKMSVTFFQQELGEKHPHT